MPLLSVFCSIVNAGASSFDSALPLLTLSAASPMGRVAVELAAVDGYRVPHISVRLVPRRSQSYRLLELHCMDHWERDVWVHGSGDISPFAAKERCDVARPTALPEQRPVSETRTVFVPLDTQLWWLLRQPVAAVALKLHNLPIGASVDLRRIALLVTALQTQSIWDISLEHSDMPHLTTFSSTFHDAVPNLAGYRNLERLELYCQEGVVQTTRRAVSVRGLVNQCPHLRVIHVTQAPLVVDVNTVLECSEVEELVLSGIRSIGETEPNDKRFTGELPNHDETADRQQKDSKGQRARQRGSLRVAVFKCFDTKSLLQQASLQRLASLDLTSETVTDLQPVVESCPCLEELRVNHCRNLTSLGDVGRLRRLRVLLASHSGVKTFGSVTSSQSLQILDLSYVGNLVNWDTEAADLHDLGSLTTLRIAGCQTENLQFLSAMWELEELDCSSSPRLTVIAPLESLPNLRILRMSNCSQLSSMGTGGGVHASLTEVDFSFCARLNPLPEVLRMQHLRKGQLRRSGAAVTKGMDWSSVTKTLAVLDVSFTAVTAADCARLREVVPSVRGQGIADSLMSRFLGYFGVRSRW